MSLYSVLRWAGCTIDNHASDLYVVADEMARKIVAQWAKDFERELGHKPMISSFRSNNLVWLDIPFAFDPFWGARQ